MGVAKTDFKKDAFEKAYMAYIDRFTLNDKHIARFRTGLKNALDLANKQGFKEAEELKATIAELNEKQSALIEKNAKGIINDTILRRQLEQIEDTLTKTSAALYKLPQNQEDIGELVDYASEYLKNPSRTWVDADFIKKIQLQWFEFPQGITFNKGKFRTGQVASIFKVKDIFLPRSSSTVLGLGRSWSFFD